MYFQFLLMFFSNFWFARKRFERLAMG